MYWYVASPAPEGKPSVADKPELAEMFHNWPAPIPELIAATDAANIIKTDLYDRPPIPKWSQQNITLLGDAAHPTLPTMGQGACMAIEDALAVTQCLLKHSEPTAAFRQYESMRLLRTKKIVEQSLLIGKVARLQNPLVAAMRNTFMKFLSQQFEKDYKTLHAYKVTVY
ncbi:MAG: FAD-dependent monooxygenase [Goleter apudmare HA4340-LM2]|jgi:2-polyprenyl-6-methoxyphenol hydroxylase-like FAD-dependent oxidoreductase|nr:FAD-dependent monooxygenase [Goleter apudmare HA4340-LM2]